MEDSQIVQLFLRRDEQALVETDSKYGTMLQRLSMRIVNNREDAQECRNDTYWKTWNSIPPQKPVHFDSYLMRICRFLSCNRVAWKLAKKRNMVFVELTAQLEECIPDSKAEMEFQNEEIGRVLNCFLEKLSKENRIIFMRRYWYAESIREIAEGLQINEGQVKMRLHRTKNKLKDYLEREGMGV